MKKGNSTDGVRLGKVKHCYCKWIMIDWCSHGHDDFLRNYGSLNASSKCGKEDKPGAK